MRNWSRTLWAYGVSVEADGREFRWPLSIQPGEAAPFEIYGWEGTADSLLADISVTAEMSNDADLSRAWWMLPYPQVIEPGVWRHSPGRLPTPPQEVLDELLASAERLVSAGAHYSLSSDLPDSHPSLHGELDESIEFDLAVYVAYLGDDGSVTDLIAPTAYDRGDWLLPPPDGVLPPGAEYSVDSYGERDGRVHYPPFVVRRFPVPELGVREVSVLFDGTSGARWVMWIGANHSTSASREQSP
ncbi:hypothetical protein [Candidatus Poriferisodalis sp.]|uniref:hypothetical protein n=1 Tax=Candidatus Poriferisodalis sp. TaxID=3101277 RepID=UPI003B01739F